MPTFPFNFFDPGKVTRGWRQNLPHLEQKEICYFVTFMAKDAMPKAAREKWEKRRDYWLRAHGLPPGLTREEVLERLPPEKRRPFERMLSAAYQRALDSGSGECLLTRLELREEVVNALAYHADRTCLIADYVVMPNHVHLLIQPFQGRDLKTILGSIRSFSARQINRMLGRTGPYWAKEPFDHMVRSRRYFERYQQYIRANPGRAGLRKDMVSLGSFWTP